MSTTVPTRTCENSSTPPLTTARLFSAPLSELLVEANVEIVEAPAEYEGFEGIALKPHVGPIQVVLPKQQSARSRDAMTRLLVGRLLGTPMLPLPESLEARTFGGAL
ncbi:hypothetical protein ABZ135_01405 [Streptomyces sp. NPDC006339]|uniref:hypothetical protein n=1 Tax=Streptomyces sp. NPDC006339 TaxID=3156755 RepID=UPI0033AC050B